MGFDEVANRMQRDREGVSPTGGAPVIILLLLLPFKLVGIAGGLGKLTVTPANRTRSLVAAYLLILFGVAGILGGAFAFIFWFDGWNAIACGMVAVMLVASALVVTAVRLFNAIETVDPLPAARTTIGR